MPEHPCFSLDAAIGDFLSSLTSPARILVAVSGGSDSIGLLFGLVEALAMPGFSHLSLCAATIDHGLRPAAADEARAVAALCAKLNVPHTILVWQGFKPRTGLMAAAREARYALLAQAAQQFGADLAVTGHTFDDQQETLLMRAERSAKPNMGIADLLLFDRRLWVARPLLACRRNAIRGFLNARKIGWIEDPSNEDTGYERVRMRVRIANGTSAPAHDAPDEDLQGKVPEQSARWLEAFFTLHDGCLACLAPQALEADRAVLAYALGRLAAVVGGCTFAPGERQIAQLLDFLADKEPGRISLARTVFEKTRHGLFLARERRDLPMITLQAGEDACWDGRFHLRNMSGRPVTVGPAFAMQDIDTEQGGKDPAHRTWLSRRAYALAKATDVCIIFGEQSREDRSASPVQPDGSHPCRVRRGNAAQEVQLAPFLAPFDRFLTRSELIFARTMARCWSAADYPRSPVGLISGKSI